MKAYNCFEHQQQETDQPREECSDSEPTCYTCEREKPMYVLQTIQQEVEGNWTSIKSTAI